MKHAYQADPMTPRLRQISTILGMLDDYGRVARLMDADIADVERREPSLPIHTSLTERRAKLRETIATLETRLAYLRKSPPAGGGLFLSVRETRAWPRERRHIRIKRGELDQRRAPGAA